MRRTLEPCTSRKWPLGELCANWFPHWSVSLMLVGQTGSTAPPRGGGGLRFVAGVYAGMCKAKLTLNDAGKIETFAFDLHKRAKILLRNGVWRGDNTRNDISQ